MCMYMHIYIYIYVLDVDTVVLRVMETLHFVGPSYGHVYNNISRPAYSFFTHTSRRTSKF